MPASPQPGKVPAEALATLGRLDNATLHDLTYQKLAARIMAGSFLPGQTMSMQRLADTLGISTTPVREALRRLAANGAVEIQAKRAVRIPRMTKARFREIGDIRLAVEGLAAEYAAQRATAAALAELEELEQAMEQALAAGVAERYLELNQAFHFAIYRMAQAPVMLSMIEGLWLQMGPIQGLYSTTTLAVGSTAHVNVLSALRRQDTEAAAEALRTDIRIGIRLLAETTGFEA